MSNQHEYYDLPASYSLIDYGIKASIKRKSLRPLIKSIEIALAISNSRKNQFNTIFSCDSFCTPHLEAQLCFYKYLASSSTVSTVFFNFPVSHFITSSPNSSLLELPDHPIKLLELNKELLSQQDNYHCSIPQKLQLPSSPEDFLSLSNKYEILIQALGDKAWEEIIINKFPFHELAHRDLSLTYKSSPAFTSNSQQPYYKHFIQSNKFNMWLLCLFACETNIGSRCFAMSFYSATTIFQFFCQETDRIFRLFSPLGLDLKGFGSTSDLKFSILRSPNATSELTKPASLATISQLKLSPAVCNGIHFF